MPRQRYQAGNLTEERGQWWIRYAERHADGTIRRPKVLVGTRAQYPTRSKARLAADRIMAEVNEAAAVTRFEHLCDRYEEDGLKHLRGYTRQAYVERIRRIRKEFKSERLDFLTSPAGIIRIEDWLNSLKNERSGANISADYRRDLRAAFGLMMRFAMKRGHVAIARNPMELVDLHNLPENTAPKRVKKMPTVDQYRALIRNPRLPMIVKVVIQIMAATGMRSCEALGLKVRDIDYAGAKIYIRQSVKGKFIDRPKTPESEATVPMDAPLANIIRRWVAEQEMIMIVDGWLFANPKTHIPFTADHFRSYYLQPAGRLVGLPSLGWHTFRHWHRALGREVKATPEEQKMMMRHSTIQMSMDGYGNSGIDNADLVREPNRKIVSILMGDSANSHTKATGT